MKTPNSGPHGLVSDKDGNIWFTAISAGYVGKLNPKTSEIAEYRPDGSAEIDPHIPVFNHNAFCGLPTKRQTISDALIRRPER